MLNKAISYIKRNGFWFLDYLKGGPIKKNLLDIQESFSFKDFKSLQKKNAPRLQELLNTVVNSTDFYKEYKNFKSLNDFPVVNKAIIKENFDSINIKAVNKSDWINVSTSGSTGTPFKIYQTKAKKSRNTADTLFFAQHSGFSLGDKLLYLRHWAAYYKKPKLIAWIQNIKQLEVEDLNKQYIGELVEKLQQDKGVKGWLGYPSGYEKICNYLDEIKSKPVLCNINSIIAMSEPLSKDLKEKMQHYFNCPVVSRYSNVENGIIAQQVPNSDNFLINWASYVIEILDLDKDEHVKPGEIGRIVITDLYNTATPLIRYDTGDVGKLKSQEDNTSNFPMFESIQGRITDILRDTNGENVNPFVLYNNLYRYPELNQIQLVQQTDRDYLFKINCTKPFQREREFLDFFGTFLGKGANINVEYVNEIPLLKSGKRKIIVNLT